MSRRSPLTPGLGIFYGGTLFAIGIGLLCVLSGGGLVGVGFLLGFVNGIAICALAIHRRDQKAPTPVARSAGDDEEGMGTVGRRF